MNIVVKRVAEVFGVVPESKQIDNTLFLRIRGIDAMSLSNWISNNFLDVNVHIKYRRLDKFSDTDWIIIEKKE
jgi:hypothetical protein